MIRALVEAGADAFRINMSHGSQAEKAKLVETVRALEKTLHRPTTIVFDLQGPKLRVGKFKGGSAELKHGHLFVFDRKKEPGDATRVELPHPELFEAVKKDTSPADRRRQGAAARRGRGWKRTRSQRWSRSAARSATTRVSTCPTC